MTRTHWPALVIGGGPAGSAAATTLARAGVAPLLTERTARFDRTVCGAFLGADAIARLDRLGVDAFQLGAQPITRVRFVNGSHVVETDLPFTAAGLSRRALDQALIEAAEAAGAVVRRGASVRNACLDSRSAYLRTGEVLSGDALFIATGKHELRGAPRQTSSRHPKALGFRAVLPATAASRDALARVVELHFFDGGYAGLLLQEDGAVNLCVSVDRSHFAKSEGPQAFLEQLGRHAPLLGERIRLDVPVSLSAVAGVPYGWRAESTSAGVFRLGDQGAVIASLAGDGIAMALASGQSAAQAFVASGPEAAQSWQEAWARKCRSPVVIAETFRRAAQAPISRGAALHVMQLFPGLASAAARLTRIDREFSAAARR